MGNRTSPSASARFPAGLIPVSCFLFPVSCFPFPVSRFPFPVSRFPFPARPVRAGRAYFTRSIFAFALYSRPARDSGLPSTSTTSAATPNRPTSSAAPTP